MTDIEFIKNCNRTVVTIPHQSIQIITERDGEKRTFSITRYLETLIAMYYSIIDEERGNISKLNKCAEAKREIKHHIREYKADSKMLPESYKNIDYSEYLADLDDTYELLLARVANEKMEAEIKNLKRERLKFWLGVIAGMSAATLGWVGLYITYLHK